MIGAGAAQFDDRFAECPANPADCFGPAEIVMGKIGADELALSPGRFGQPGVKYRWTGIQSRGAAEQFDGSGLVPCW